MPKKATFLRVIEECENQLGWVSKLSDTEPAWKYRAIETGRLRRTVENSPDARATPENLLLAIALLKHRRETVKTPSALLMYLDEALKRSYQPPPLQELDEAIEAAVAHEQTLRRPEADYWISRLTRAQGPYRADVLTDWHDAGRDHT